MIHEHELPRFEFVPAPHGQRFGASVIDAVVIGILNAMANALHLSLLVILIPCLYFVLCAKYRNGQTLGKTVFGLRVVSDNGEPLTTNQLVKRETIGRFLSAFGFGYFRLLAHAEAKGWHDSVSGTRVVAIHSAQPLHGGGSAGITSFGNDSSTGGIPLWQKSLLAVTVVLLLALVGVYTLLYTAVPLRSIAESMEQTGIEVENISGSFMRGIRIGRFASTSEGSSVELNDLVFHIDLPALFQRNDLILKKLSVSKGALKIQSKVVAAPDSLRRLTDKFDGSAKEPASPSANAQAAGKSKISRLFIEQIDISDFQIDESDGTKNRHLELKRFFIDALELTRSGLSLGRLYVESDYLDVDLGQFSVTKERVRLGTLAKIKVKAPLAPEILRRDFDVEGVIDFDLVGKRMEKLYLAAAERRIQVKTDSQGLTIQTYGFSPEAFFVHGLPLKNVSLQIGPINQVPGLATGGPSAPPSISGSMSFEGKPFTLRNDGVFIHQAANRIYALKVEPQALLFPSKAPAKPPLTAALLPDESVQDWLAGLSFEQRAATLSIEQQASIAKSAALFANPALAPAPGAPTNLASAGAQPVAVNPAPPPPARLPAKANTASP